MAARLKVTLFWYTPHRFCCVNQVLLMQTRTFTQQKQRGLYQSKVTSSIAAIQRPGHWVDNCKMVYFGFVSNFETRPRSFFGVFGLFNFVEKALGTRLPLGVPMGTNGILSFLRIWLMIIEICEYERHLIFRRDSSLVQFVTFSILSGFFFLHYGKSKTLHFKSSTFS